MTVFFFLHDRQVIQTDYMVIGLPVGHNTAIQYSTIRSGGSSLSLTPFDVKLKGCEILLTMPGIKGAQWKGFFSLT